MPITASAGRRWHEGVREQRVVGGRGEGATRNYEKMERLTKWGELREIKKHGYQEK